MIRRRYRWVLGGLPERPRPMPEGLSVRSTDPADDQWIAALLQRSFAESLDDRPARDFRRSLRTWRAVDGADDAASTLAFDDGEMVGACLVAHEVAGPLIYDIAVAPTHRRKGIGGVCLSRSLVALRLRGADMASSWITVGNSPSERLHRSLGFVPVARPLDSEEGVLFYRAAQVAEQLDRQEALSAAAEVTEDLESRLWIVSDQPQEPRVVSARNTPVHVGFIRPEEAGLVRQIASRGIPLRHASWLLQIRHHPGPAVE